ncbi:MAG: YfiR family protein [Marinilabiliaceae bacterium]
MKKIYLLLALLIMVPVLSMGQVAKYKAVFTTSFIRYIGWPDEVREGDFVIGVVGAGNIASRIEKQSEGKKFGFQEVIVEEYNSVDDIDRDCQVVYVSERVNFSRNADAIFQKVGDKTLVVTESNGATDHGAMINFVIRDETLKFEIHKGNASENGLQISSRLENMNSAIVL